MTMKGWKQGIKKAEGSITLEACIAVTLFMFLILTMYSLFMIFEAQGKIAHTIMKCGESISLDPLVTNSIEGDIGSVNDIVGNVGIFLTTEHPEFTSTGKWYTPGTKASENAELRKVIEERFAAFFGIGGKSEADSLLKKLRVQDGLKGLDFGESYIDKKGNLNIIVKYNLDYIFDYPAFHLEPIKMKQQAVSHLWK